MTGTATQARPSRPAWPRAGRIVCALAVALFVVVLLRTAWMSDDAYITLRTVDNLVHGHGLRWNVAERVQTFTHPLWLFLIAAIYAVTREPFYSTLALSLICSLAAVLLLVWHRRASPWAGAVMVAALVFSKGFVDYSTSGLENPLTHLMIAGLVILLPAGRPSDRRLTILSLLTGLAVLARTDNVVIFGPALAVALVRHGAWRRAAGLVLAGLAPLLVWHLFATFYYGYPFPNTALAKLDTGIPAGELARQGWRYLGNALRVDPLSIVLIATGVAAGIAARSARPAALAAGVVLHLAYIVGIGGDFMSGRFLTPALFLSVALVGEIPWDAARPLGPIAVAAVAALGFAAPYPTVLSGSDYGQRLTEAVDASGIADERRYYFSQSGLFGGQPGWSRPQAESWRTGRELEGGNVAITVAGAVGVMGYRAGPGVHIVDYHALGDPLLSRLPVVRRDPAFDVFLAQFQYPPVEWGWRPGHFLRSIPAGYLQSLAMGVNYIADRDIARMYDDVRRLTRDPLWSGDRLAVLVRRLGHGWPEVHGRPRPEFTPIPWDELIAAQPGNPEARYQRGRLRERAGDLEGALDDFSFAMRLDPSHGRAIVAAAAVDARLERWGEGLALIDRALALDAMDANAWRYRAVLLDGAKRRPEAIEALEKAAALEPRLAADMDANVGLEYAKLEQFEQAVSWLRRAQALDPRSARTSLILGRVMAMQGKNREAIAELEHALALDPALEAAAVDLATVRVTAGDSAGAINGLERFLAANPGSADALFREGAIYAAQGDAVRAAERWRKAAAMGHEGARAALETAAAVPR